MWKNIAFSEPSGRNQLISLGRQRRVPATAFVICAFLCWCCVFLCQSRFVAADCILQFASSRSELLFMRLVYVCFLHVSAYICMFLTFSVRSFRANAALQKIDQNPKQLCQNPSKIHPKSHPKSIQNPSQMHPKPTTLVTRSYPTATLRASPQVVIPLAFLATLG